MYLVSGPSPFRIASDISLNKLFERLGPGIHTGATIPAVVVMTTAVLGVVVLLDSGAEIVNMWSTKLSIQKQNTNQYFSSQAEYETTSSCIGRHKIM